MKKSYFKSFCREVIRNFGRFVAIIAIVALGVGFLTGLLATTPNMKKSVDAYFDDNNSADVFIKSTRGFSDDDIEKLTAESHVEKLSAVASSDLIASYNGKSPVARVFQLDKQDYAAKKYVNQPLIKEGRNISADNECVVESADGSLINVNINDRLTMNGKEYTVVGICSTPWYFSAEREPSSEGSGKAEIIAYITDSLGLPVYTDVFLTVKKAASLNAFSKAYEKEVESATTSIKALSRTINDEWYAEMIEKYPSMAGELEKPEFFTFDRNSNPSFVSFKLNVDKVAAVATVFPLFFFLVAALVALTTMTRMVEEERGQIGTLKSLGYSSSSIRFKYVAYALLASGLGCVIGALLGFWMLPAIIWNAYKFMYALPALTLAFNFVQTGIACLVAVGGVVVAGLFACNKTLKEKPSELLLPKAPAPGKRILLERVTPIWKRLKFKYKSTFRNVFRYKKHMFMTLIGIAGCTALMLTGFGLSDSINGVTSKQYNNIFHFDYSINYAKENNVDDFLASDKVKAFTNVYSASGSVTAGKNKESLAFYSSNNMEELSEFITFKPRGKKEFSVSSDSVIMTEKVASNLGLKIGDRFVFADSLGKETSFTLTNITENYVGSYVYVGSSAATFTPNAVIVKANGAVDAEADAKEILGHEGVMGVDFLSESRKSFDNLSSSIGFVVLVLILCAGALAVIVLYNLTNININERKKELATLKVLGYSEKEVAFYIYREIAILTVLGILAGLVVGFFLHWFVLVQIESVQLMFYRAISPLSYLFSALLTFGFSILVDLIMLVKLRKISMVESMKAPE